MCDVDGVHVGWAVAVATCDGTITLEYFDEDGVSEGGTLPAGWKPCVQGVTGPPWEPGFEELVWDSAVDLDFSADYYKTLTVDDTTEFTTSNLAPGVEVVLRLVGGASPATLTFPTDWVWGDNFVEGIASGEMYLINLTAFGTTDADVISVAQFFEVSV